MDKTPTPMVVFSEQCKVQISTERAVILLTNIIMELNDKVFEKIDDLEDYLKIEIGLTDDEWAILLEPSLRDSNVIN